MLVHPLVDGIEGTALGGEKEICTRVVRELEVFLVTGYPFAPESNRSDAVLPFAKGGLGILV